jgi:hypothetical protein
VIVTDDEVAEHFASEFIPVATPAPVTPVTPFSVAQETAATLLRIEALLLRQLSRQGTAEYRAAGS